MEEILKSLADNPKLFEATKEKVLEKFVIDYQSFSNETDDARVGQLVRAITLGRSMIEKAFTEIAKCKTIEESSEPPNPAR